MGSIRHVVPVDQLEELPEDPEEATRTMQLDFMLLFWRGTNEFLHLLHEFRQDVDVHQPEKDEEAGRHRGADDAANLRETVESLRDGGCAGSNKDGSDDDDAALSSA